MDPELKSDDDGVSLSPPQYAMDSSERNVVRREPSTRSRSVPDIDRGVTMPTMIGSSSSSSSVYFSAHGDSQVALVESTTTERPIRSCAVYYGRRLGYVTDRGSDDGDDRQSAEVLFFSPLEPKPHLDSLVASRTNRSTSSSELSEQHLDENNPVRCLVGAEGVGFDVPFAPSQTASETGTDLLSLRNVSVRVRNVLKHFSQSDCDSSKSSGNSDFEHSGGLPEIYLMPSDVRDCNSYDGVLNFASDKEDNLSDHREEVDHENSSDDTAESSLVLASMDAAYFRDKPRGEPMGSESGGGVVQLPTVVTSASFPIEGDLEPSDEERNVEVDVGSQISALDTWSSWVRGDVEGADNDVDDRPVVTQSNNLLAFVNQSSNVDNEIMDSQGNVRPPLVGQSEENQDVVPVVDYKQKVDSTPPPARSLSDEELESQASVSLSSESKDSLAIRVSNLLNASIQSEVSPTVNEQNPVVECELFTDTGGSKIDVPIEVSVSRPSVRRRDYYISVDDDLFKQNSSLESTDTEQPPAVSGYQSDQRASSPSVLSVSSMASSRRLEWDSGADIGYGGPKVLYGLSTLERMAIGTFLQRTEPEGKSALGKDRPNRQGVTSVTPQVKPKDRDSVASLEDVVVFVLDGNNSPGVATDEKEGRSNSFPDSEDTDGELVRCYTKQLSKESGSSNSETQLRYRPTKESCQQRKKSRRPQSNSVRSLNTFVNIRPGPPETFLVNVAGQRSSSLTDLSHVTRLNVRDAPPHSNSVSDVRGLNVQNRSVSSSASMVSSSSSSTVVGTSFDTKKTPVSSNPFCSTVINDSPSSLPLKPNFNTPVSVVTAQEVPPCQHQDKKDDEASVDDDTKREEDFNQLLAVTGRLFCNLDPPPTVSERQKLLRAFLEVVTNEHNCNLQQNRTDLDSVQSRNKSTFVVQAPLANCDVRLSSKRNSPTKSNSNSITDGPSVLKISSNSASLEEERVGVPSLPLIQRELRNDSDVSDVVHHHERETLVGFHNSQREDIQRGQSSSPSSRSTATKGVPSHGSQLRFNVAALAPRTTSLNARFCSASTSGGSESTMDTIRERKHQYADDTLASSFEYYGVPSTKGLKLFRAPPICSKETMDCNRGGYLLNMLRRSRAAERSATSSRSSTRLTTSVTTSSEDVHTSSSTNNDRRSSRVTVKKVSYIAESLPSSDVQLDSSTPSPEDRVHSSRRFLDRLQVMENLNHEGLSVVKELVRMQRNSYIRKLKREVDWLERVEAILVGGENRPLYHSGTLNRKKPPQQPRSARLPADRIPPVSILSRHMRDFGQCFPTPQVSEDEINNSIKYRSLSVGVQTSDSLLGNKSNISSQRRGSRHDRPIVNIPLTIGKRNLKQTMVSARQDRTAPRQTVRTATKPNSRTPSNKQRPVAWFYPLGDEQPRHLISAGPSVTFRRGPADGAQADHLGFPGTISSRPAATQEPLSLQEAFKLLKSDFIHTSTARQQRLKAKQKATARKKLTSLTRVYAGKHTKPLPISSQHHNPQPRNLSHRQMRDQTEKLYQILSEVTEQQELKRREDMYRTNRLMAQMFKKKLQEKVLQGKVSMSNTQKCM